MLLVFNNLSIVGVGQILCVCPFPFGIESGMWGVIALMPDHCLAIYFVGCVCCKFSIIVGLRPIV